MIPNWLYMSPSDSPDHPGSIYTIQNLQRSPIPQTSNWSGTFVLLFLTIFLKSRFFLNLQLLKSRFYSTVSFFTSNIGSQENWGFDHCSSGVSGKGIKVINVGSNAGQDSGCSDQGVKSSNQLWQVSDFNLLGNSRSWKVKKKIWTSLDKFRQV